MSPFQKKLAVALSIFVVILGAGGIFYWLRLSHSDNTVTYTAQTQTGGELITENTGSIQVQSNGEIGFVLEVIGEASYLQDSKRENLKQEMKVLAGGVIVTEEGSNLTIVLTDNSLIRIGEKTTLSFSDANKVVLENGDVWARIIKPLTDDSFFTIETSDSSAGIRGTAVLVQKRINRTKTTVVDSSRPNDSVVLNYQVNGANETEEINTEEIVEVSKQGKKKQKITTENFLEVHDFAPEFLKKDIIYLTLLEEKLASQSGSQLLEKIQKEIQESLPKDNEINNFFTSESTREAMKLLQKGRNGGTNTGEVRMLSPDEQKKILLDIIAGDLEITKGKQALQRLRDNSNASSPGDERKNQIHELEQKIRDAETKWGNTFKDNFEKNYKIGTTIDTQSGTGVLSENIQNGSGAVREKPILDNSNVTMPKNEIPGTQEKTPTPKDIIGTQQDGTKLPNSTKPNSIVNSTRTPTVTSGPASPKPTIPVIKKSVSGSATPR